MADGVRFRRLLHLVQYAVVSTAIAFLALSVVSLPAGAGFVGVKIGLFVVGMAYLGYGTYLAWPSSPEDLAESDDDPAAAAPTRFQRFVRRFPPIAWLGLHPAEEYADWVKVYATSLFMFVTSYTMESVFGVVA